MTLSKRPVPECAVDFVKRAEACRLTAYRDSAGVPTIGYGHTAGVSMGMMIGERQAEQFLREDLGEAAYVVCRHGGATIARLTDHKYAALISFAFNLGGGPLAGVGEWTIWRRLRAGQLDQVPLEMERFVNAHVGVKAVRVPGLVNRRAAEVALWNTPDEAGAASVPVPAPRPDDHPSSLTRRVATPPTPTDPDPPARSKTMTAAVLTTVAASAEPAKQAMDSIAPMAAHSEWVGHIVASLAVLAAVASLATVALYWWHKHKARTV